ncbi:ABC transporter permease [Corynebacterium lubricantis]|uniref:ABC transporter permease n=1 Tax=Corynebacterium lubricantis TaxID=541095 RepID=UPI000373882B|nr:ABC transporter permease [Corynebacterium lubricantis]
MTIQTRTPETTSSNYSRTSSLARAETKQFFRNPTLLFTSLVFPAGFAGTMYGLYAAIAADFPANFPAAVSMEIFVLLALAFVQFYSVLSMVATRRDERVLKRLRTGEATDANIILAICTPGAIVTLLSFLAFATVIGILSGSAPVNFLLLTVAMLGGLVIASSLALVTAAYTRNAEAAQISSLPVMGLAMLSQQSIRSMFPENIADIIALTPFAAISDLTYLGWSGLDRAGEVHAGFVDTLSEAWPAILAVIAWSVATAYWAKTTMRWDSHRD